ncbi:MAG TPA: FecR domain-containing protein [Pyrinomonadaceae bacterium]|nr:FecR domain-containing protein [Pyrinomonadaceae bacterium]
MKKRELENILDEVTGGIRSEQVDDRAASEAGDRVWSRMSGAGRMLANHAQDAGAPIEGCADFQTLIPAYLNGKVSEARALLLVDHTHECIPCRKALKVARQARAAGTADRAAQAQPRRLRTAPRYHLRPVVLRWGIAAMLVVGLGLIALPIVQRYVPVGPLDATVQAADGPLYVVADSQTRALNVGEKIGRGEVIRTPKDARAVVRLEDGSTIELKDRSEVSLKRTLDGTTLHLDGGSVIVQAARQQQPRRSVVGKLLRVFHLAPQGWDNFYVETNDAVVSVTGTTFAVNAGTKGSRVSVIEGEVHLDRNGKEKLLGAGEQATTNAAIATVPVKEEVAWSRNAAQYAQTLDALAALKKELNAVPKPGVRNSTRLLDMMPQTTVMYAAVPNLAASIVESNRLIEERIQQNPALRDWFATRREARGPGMNQAIATLKDFGDQLGDEIAVGAGMSDQGQPTEPIVLAQLKNPGGFRAFFDAEVQKLTTSGKGPQVTWIDDPKSAAPNSTAGDHPLYVWIDGDVLVGSPKLEQLQVVANGGGAFSGTPFYARIAQVYQEGAGIVVAADLEKIIAHTRGVRRIAVGDNHEQALNQLGIFNVTSFVLDSKDTDGKTHTRAVLSYNQADHGITSWLARPAPMGSLEYISPDANVVAGFAVKNPTAVVDDLLTVMSNVCPDLQKHLDDLQKNHGLNLRSDFAAPLGGEYAFAIDGPILPTPSWKLVFQVNDPAHLQQTFEQVVAEVNKQLATEGKQGLEWSKADSGGRTFYTLRAKDLGTVEVNYVFANGYMIACPTRALVDKALSYHDSGATLLHSPQFTAGLPADGNVNFSAFVYQNIASLAKPLANQVGNMPAGKQNAITMAATMEPTLAYAYAYGDHIEVAANTEGGPFGLSPATLLGMPNAFELHSILEQAIKGSGSTK